MRSGTLRTKVTIQRPTVSADAVGQRVPSWETVAKRFGSLIQKSGREIEGSAVQTVTQWVLRIRYESALSSLSPAWRITTDTQTFDIESVANQNSRNRELVLTMIEVV